MTHIQWPGGVYDPKRFPGLERWKQEFGLHGRARDGWIIWTNRGDHDVLAEIDPIIDEVFPEEGDPGALGYACCSCAPDHCPNHEGCSP